MTDRGPSPAEAGGRPAPGRNESRSVTGDEARRQQRQRLALLPALCLLLVTFLLWGRPGGDVHGSSHLVNVLNIVLSTLVSLVVCFLLARAFAVRGLVGILFLGCTCLITGASSFGLASQTNPNILATTFNLNAALTGLCNLAGAVLLLRPGRPVRARSLWVMVYYVATLIAVQAVGVAVTAGWLPLFFIQGRGGTPLRQAVVAATIGLYVVSGLVLRRAYRRRQEEFTRWYALSLDLRAVGLLAALGNTAIGSALFWVSRAGIYLGGIYLLIAGLAAMREAHLWRTTLEETLSERERQLQQLSDNLPGSAVYQYTRGNDGKARFLYISASIERLCGVQPEAVLRDASALQELAVPEDLAALQAAELASQRDLTVFEYDVRMHLPDGRLRWMHLVSSPRRLATGQVVWDGVQTDITERKHGEESLRELLAEKTALAAAVAESEARLRDSSHRLETALNAAKFGTWAHALNSSDTNWDERMREIWGVPPSEPVTTVEMMSRVVEEDRHAVERAVELRKQSKESISVDFRIRRADGIRWVRSVGSALRDADGTPVMVAGVAADITEEKLADEKLDSLQAQLAQAQKMEAIGRLAGGVAHDFNNLLTVINGHAFLAKSKLAPDAAAHKSLDEIAKAGERAAALTRQLLAFSRKQILQPRRFDLNGLLKNASSILQRMVGEDVVLRLALGAEECFVHADPHQMEQVLFNLAVNARDAMPTGGSLRIATSVGPARDGMGRREVRLKVSDDGVGIDPATQLRIFEPFFTTKEVGKGTGLGLSTVQGIVEQSGGAIAVESAPGMGATFVIYLPLAEAPEKKGQRVAAAAPERGGSETLLVVEDQPEVLAFVVGAMRNYGYRVLAASGAEDALAIWKRESGKIDLVVSDVVMPGMSGSELMREVRELHPAAKFLFMSGYTDDVMLRHGVQGQGFAFLQKPFRAAELAAKVRSVLAAGSSQRA